MKQRKCCALLMAALLMVSPAAFAQETAPLAAGAEQMNAQERVSPVGFGQDYRGVAVSEDWLWQARLGNRLLNMRLYTTQGEQVLFMEKLSAAKAGGDDLCLTLRGKTDGVNLLLQLNQDAVDTLKRLNVTEIVVVDTRLYVQAAYRTEDLDALRRMFHVEENELLCVSGEDRPVTVVSVDGVRRQITK